MIKVLHYIRHLGLGGTEKTCQLFAEHTNKSKFEVAVAYDKNGYHPRRGEFEKGGYKLFAVDGDINPVIETFKPNIIHVYRSGFPEFPEPNKDFNPTGISFIETNVFGHLDQNRDISKTLFMSKWLMDNTLSRYDSKFFKSGRFDFVNNPVEEPYTHQRLAIADQWHAEGAIILGRCGRPDPGIYHALNTRAAFLLRAQGYDVRFIAVAPPANMVQDLVDWDIPFHVIEPTTEPLILSTFYNSLDIYAHARADGETFGVNIAEAMMHNLPVVTHIAEPSVPGMSVFQAHTELVDNNVTGFIVPNEIGAYTDALKRLIDSPVMRYQMGDAGHLKAMDQYRVLACVRKLERIYEKSLQ